MLAYRVSKANAHFIRTRLNGNAPPAPKQDTTYIIFPGGGIEPEVVTEPEFYNRYEITTRISRRYGRYVVEKKATAPSPGDAGKV